MDEQEFRDFGNAAIEFLIDYHRSVSNLPVLPSVKPGHLFDLLPMEIPENSERWQDIMEDFKKLIVPGLTHWQSSHFHAYFPSQTSYPSMIGELLSAGLATIGFNWTCSPSATELEVIVIDWLGKFLNLPQEFLPSFSEKGSGTIQGSASESIFIAAVAAREEKVNEVKIANPELSECEIRSKLVGYGSIHSNSAIEKTGILTGTKIRLLETDEYSALHGEVVEKAIKEDIGNGLIPYVCIATIGTTGTCAIDNMEEIGPVCKKYNIRIHVDAAYAGGAFCLPEYEHLRKGLEYADSINFNLHKWMLVNFDCTAMWVKDVSVLNKTFGVDRIYLEQMHPDPIQMPEYRHWQIALGRRFRSLKVWITLRAYGQDKIRSHLRNHIELSKMFYEFLSQDERFEKPNQTLSLVFFRLKGDDSLTKMLLEKINERKKIYMIHGIYQNKIVIRFTICGMYVDEKDVNFAWSEVKTATDEIFSKIELESLENNSICDIVHGKSLIYAPT